MTETGSRSIRLLSTSSFLVFIILGFMVAALGPTLPFLAEHTGSSLGVISYLFIAQNVGYMLGSYFSGHLYDRLAGTRIMGIALLAAAPALAVVPVARSLALLLAAIALLGLLQGAVDVGGNFLILRTAPEGRSIRMNALHLFFGVGAFLCPLVFALTLRWSREIAWGYWGLALATLPAALWVIGLRDPSRTPSASSAGESRIRILPVALVAAFIFLIVASEAGFGSWIYTYALRRALADRVTAGYLTSVFWGSFTVGRLASTLLSLRLKPRLLIALSLAGCMASAVLLLAAGTSAAAVWTAAAGFGFFIGPLFANTMTLAGEAMSLSGRVTGIFLVGTSLGALFLPWLIGQLFEPMGPWTMPAALLATLVVAFACFLLVLRSARRSE